MLTIISKDCSIEDVIEALNCREEYYLELHSVEYYAEHSFWDFLRGKKTRYQIKYLFKIAPRVEA